MANPWDDLKRLLSDELSDTIGELWSSEQDRAFLTYNAEKFAKHVVRLKTATTDQQRKEAQFNLDMLQAALASYAAQKAMVGAQSAEEMAKKVVAFVVGILLKAKV